MYASREDREGEPWSSVKFWTGILTQESSAGPKPPRESQEGYRKVWGNV
jgi:hypothetical protein